MSRLGNVLHRCSPTLGSHRTLAHFNGTYIGVAARLYEVLILRCQDGERWMRESLAGVLNLFARQLRVGS